MTNSYQTAPLEDKGCLMSNRGNCRRIYDSDLEDINYYIDGIEKWCQVTKKEICINLWHHSISSFERVIKASCNALRLSIKSSSIKPRDKFDFSGPEYKTTYLSFAYCGEDSDDEGTNNSSRFENIIKAISKCGLKESLQVINLDNTEIDKDIVDSVLEKYDMTSIAIEETNPTPEYSFLY